MKKKYTYQIVSERKEDNKRLSYFLKCNNSNAGTEMWVGESKLRRMYREGRIVGNLTDQQRYAIGRDKRKPRTTYNEPIDIPPNAPEVAPELPKMYNLPDVFEVERPVIQHNYRLAERDGFFYIENDIHILGRTNDKMYAERYLEHVNKYGPPKDA